MFTEGYDYKHLFIEFMVDEEDQMVLSVDIVGIKLSNYFRMEDLCKKIGDDIGARVRGVGINGTVRVYICEKIDATNRNILADNIGDFILGECDA